MAAIAAGSAGWWYAPTLAGARGVADRSDRSPRPATSRAGRPPTLTLLQFARSGRWEFGYRRVLKEEYWGLSLGKGYRNADPGVPKLPRRLMFIAAGLGLLATLAWHLCSAWSARREPRSFARAPAGSLLTSWRPTDSSWRSTSRSTTASPPRWERDFWSAADT